MKKQEENEPGTSNSEKPNDEEMARLLQATDEILENKAKSMNLSSLNVRSILHHLIKYPSTIDVLLGIRETDQNDLPSVRNTRSRKKGAEDASNPPSAVQTPKKFALRIEDTGPKNFLDLEYEEDDEFDEDYVVEDGKSPTAGDSEIDVDDEEEEQIEENEENPDGSIILFDEEEEEDDGNEGGLVLNMTLNSTATPRADSAAPVPTLDNVLDDDDYRDFVMSLQCPPEDSGDAGPSGSHNKSGAEKVEDEDDDDDDDDEDYNVCADNQNLQVDDWDETRQDKTTQIPRHEVKALMMDTLLAEKDIPIHAFPDEAICAAEETPTRKTQKERDAEVSSRLGQAPNCSESCSLISGSRPVTFRPAELQILRLQLEQHVQLLTQFVITCHHDEKLTEAHNRSQLMLNQLDDLRHAKPASLFATIPTLDAAIESCHEIAAIPPCPAHQLVTWPRSAPRPAAARVLAGCRAVVYPELVPMVQPEWIEKPLPFLHEENLMLALALLQFAHLPRRAEKGAMDRYTAISLHCLPARSAYTIRSHLKTMRRSIKNPSPIHQIVQAAEQGECKLEMPPKAWKTCAGPIVEWAPGLQPQWYRDSVRMQKVEVQHKESLVLTPVKEEIREESSTASGSGSQNFIQVGQITAGQPVVMDREHIKQLVIRLIKENEEVTSPSKRRKNSTPVKLTQLAEVSRIVESLEIDQEASFPIPTTPGRRTPDEETLMVMDLETHSMTWPAVPATVSDENPITPRGIILPSGAPTDFSHMGGGSGSCESTNSSDDVAVSVCMAPMGMLAESKDDSASMTSLTMTSSMTVEDECSSSGLDLVPPVDDDVEKMADSVAEKKPAKTSRKRTRLERETMGTQGLDDRALYNQQRAAVARKIIDDVKQRLFMHKLTWQRLEHAMTSDERDGVEKIQRIILALSNHPELLNLVLLYAPRSSIPPEFQKKRQFQNYQMAVDMILDIERYINAAKLKEPTIRGVFRFIRSFELEDLKPEEQEEQVAARFFQLLGQDRPLWKKLERNFGCLPFKRKPRIEQFEFVDLTQQEVPVVNSRKRGGKNPPVVRIDHHFETIDNIDEVSSTTEKHHHQKAEHLMVKCGELGIHNGQEDTFVQFDVFERQWSRKDDITLLTRFNEAVRSDANFSEIQIPALVPELQFGAKSIVARLQYLLAELKN